jgi:hypothetical protein
MKDTLTFLCPSFPIPQEETESIPGGELASSLCDEIRRSGVADCEDPFEDSSLGIWLLTVSVQGKRFNLQLNIDGIGQPIQDRWVLGIGRIGLFARLFDKQNTLKTTEQLFSAVQKILKEKLHCTEIQTWTYAEFLRAMEGRRV